MGTRDGLEAALLANWDRETLAVYADQLQAEGDPRGELIALDLELATRSTPELVARRTSLMTGWLGRLVPSNPHTPWIGDSFKFGFVDDLVLTDNNDEEGDARLAQMLASPLAPYLKRVTIRGDLAHVNAMLRALADDRQHVWLTELSIRLFGAGQLVAEDVVEQWIAATPALGRVELIGDHVIARFPHPVVTTLVLRGSWALPGIYEELGSPPNVATLDLAFEQDSNSYRAAQPPPAAIVMPALRRLDLSSNEPEGFLQQQDDYDEEPAYHDGAPASGTPTALAALALQPIRKQLTHLKMPSIRSREELERLEQLVSHMPALEEVEVTRAHYFKLPAKLATSKARLIRPSGWSWPNPAELADGDRLCVALPGSIFDESVTLADAARVMEQRYEELDEHARYVWTLFWSLIDELGKLEWKSNPSRTPERSFPASVMVEALDACNIGGSGGWREFREVLRSRAPFPAGALLTMHRTRDH